MKFRTTLLVAGKTATGIGIPDDVMAALAAGRKPPVRVTINGYTYRSTVATVDGNPMVGVSADVRERAGVAGGDDVEVDVELDTAPRELEVPPELAAALAADAEAAAYWETLSYSNRQWHVLQVTSAKTDATRDRRIEKTVTAMREKRAR